MYSAPIIFNTHQSFLTLIIFNSCTPARATRHVTHINESCHTHQRVTRRATYINESCHTYQRVTSRCHATHGQRTNLFQFFAALLQELVAFEVVAFETRCDYVVP